jgi:hypothetical protein
LIVNTESTWRSEVAVAVLLGVGLVGGGLVWALASLFGDGAAASDAQVSTLAVTAQLAAVSAGVALLWRRPKIRAGDLALALVSVILVLLGLEGALRVRARLRPPEGEMSASLGWVTPAHQVREREQPGFGVVRYSTTDFGFRRFGDPAVDGFRVLVIGDSFTKAVEVSDGETYYDLLAQARPDIEVFAYGGAGYGTIQEYLILDRFIDVIDPDLIIWQFCPNDLLTSMVGLESESLENNNGMVRPYLIEGKIRHLYPSRFAILRHFRLARLIRSRVQILRVERLGEPTVENDLVPSDPRIRRSVETTVASLRLVRSRAGGVPVVGFSVNETSYGGENEFEEASRTAGIAFIRGIPTAIEEASRNGIKTDGLPYDGHWNAQGHAIASAVLLDSLEARGLLPSGSRRP